MAATNLAEEGTSATSDKNMDLTHKELRARVVE